MVLPGQVTTGGVIASWRPLPDTVWRWRVLLWGFAGSVGILAIAVENPLGRLAAGSLALFLGLAGIRLGRICLTMDHERLVYQGLFRRRQFTLAAARSLAVGRMPAPLSWLEYPDTEADDCIMKLHAKPGCGGALMVPLRVLGPLCVRRQVIDAVKAALFKGRVREA